ncbi:MAG: OmpA family protein [Bradymonadia bacterium]
MLLTASGCGPKYPNCDDDGHCAEQGQFCVNKKCEECRDNSHCSSKGAGFICQSSQCQRKVGYCDENVACPGSGKCRNNECGPQCLADDGPDGCGEGQFCQAGTCQQRPECGPNGVKQCPEGFDCVGGACTEQPVVCEGEPVYFDFNKSNIKGSERGKIEAIANCMKAERAPSSLTVEGHCDERGTEEYNLALGEDRANKVKKFLSNMGVDSGKLDSVSYGETRPAVSGSGESAWRQNRRANFRSN